ncbi:MAG: hypothetical protein O9327_12230 [Polaromonas sp.]|nr:hypothetical protein [Polaromonas sp.]
MNAQLTQGLLHLLNQDLKKSQWLTPHAAGLEAAADAAGPVESAEKPRYLNGGLRVSWRLKRSKR